METPVLTQETEARAGDNKKREKTEEEERVEQRERR
jgi:hypothetical protein